MSADHAELCRRCGRRLDPVLIGDWTTHPACDPDETAPAGSETAA